MSKRIKTLFKEHPNSINETYKEHFQIASKIGFKLFFASAACITHSIFPFMFKTTASRYVQEINELFTNRNPRKS